MAVCASFKAFIAVSAVVLLILAIASPSVEAQSSAPAPAPTSDDSPFESPWEEILINTRDPLRWDFNRPRNRIPADACGSGAHIPDSPSGCFILHFLLNFLGPVEMDSAHLSGFRRNFL
ncbi:hypothetical protein DKX38_021021 [Salix brachista]|uniref:Leucine-rich repeat-containing N-terminal plant-type domain-containing protein n=1 Tax=Salix brachista TaxID=2182728 RepID=A0A5N5K9D7_9ROSI|nr:hypothetical protein DKX38_021021 [Salix brachista]